MKNILTTIFILLFTNHVFANNLAISAPVYSAETLTFTISWDNSWNISTGPSNHDAVWVFIKRQKCHPIGQRDLLAGRACRALETFPQSYQWC
jgi:hypothetical protein